MSNGGGVGPIHPITNPIPATVELEPFRTVDTWTSPIPPPGLLRTLIHLANYTLSDPQSIQLPYDFHSTPSPIPHYTTVSFSTDCALIRHPDLVNQLPTVEDLPIDRSTEYNLRIVSVPTQKERSLALISRTLLKTKVRRHVGLSKRRSYWRHGI